MNAKVTFIKNFQIGDIDRRIFGSFVEHLGRAVYTGIYEPGHPQADDNGFRQDVVELVKELGVSHVRYPGGNFLSGYDWKDGIGPKESRMRRLDLAWKSIESNQVGIDEFYDWSKLVGTFVTAAVNMGTGTPKEAAELMEYCNYPGGTYWSDLRIKNGHHDPMGIKLWCVGNEMDGAWQICHLDADDYGKKALETAKMLKWVDDSVELVVCGSSSSWQPTFPEWDRKVLEYTYDVADYISLHRYYENEGNDDDFLASFVDMEHFIHTISAVCDYVKALKRSTKTMMLSFDEWNVWYQQHQAPHDWMEAPPLIEDRYSLLDALVFAGLGMTLINNCDRVKIACLAQLVNVIAPILTEKDGGAIRQSIFYPFKYLSQYAKGVALKPVIDTPFIETKYGKTPLLHLCATYNEADGEFVVFALNISRVESLTVSLDMQSFGAVKMIEHISLRGADTSAVNTFARPDAVVPIRITPAVASAGVFEVRLEQLSWHVMRFGR